MKTIKCRIYKGVKYEEDGKIKFLLNDKVDKGYIHTCTEKEFEIEIKKWAMPLGYFVDQLDEKDNVIWSNYREIEEIQDIDQLRLEYKELSGDEADKRWKANKLTDEINKLKEN